MVFAAVLVAACTTVISGLGEADAAWLKAGPGTGYAAALKLLSPGTPVLDAIKCNNGGTGPSATLHWSYPAPLPPGFEVLTSLTQNSPTNSTAVTTTPATVPLLSNSKPTYVSVRATAGAWRGPRSPEVAAC